MPGAPSSVLAPTSKNQGTCNPLWSLPAYQRDGVTRRQHVSANRVSMPVPVLYRVMLPHDSAIYATCQKETVSAYHHDHITCQQRQRVSVTAWLQVSSGTSSGTSSGICSEVFASYQVGGHGYWVGGRRYQVRLEAIPTA